MKLLLVTVSIIVVFTADSQDFRNEPGEAQLLPGGSEGQGEAEGGQNLPGGPKMLVSPTQVGANQTSPERSNSTLEDHQMKIGDMAMVLGRSRWCRSRGGRCSRPKFPCADGYQESDLGRPYCTSKKRRCCYPAPRVCVGDSISFGSQCLTFSAEDEKLNWNNAAAACAANGGRLATLEHPDDIHYYVTENYPRDTFFWIGATDAENEGSWVWPAGQPLGDQFPWLTGEPNGGTVENCLFVAAGPGYYDGRCSSTLRYICEVRPF